MGFHKIINGVVVASMYFTGYVFGVAGLSRVSMMDSPKIEDQAHLEEILPERAALLGIDDLAIRGVFSEIPRSYSLHSGDEEYEVVLGGSDGHNLSVLDHELYHIADGHTERGNSLEVLLVYLFHDEPKAVLYSLIARFTPLED